MSQSSFKPYFVRVAVGCFLVCIKKAHFLWKTLRVSNGESAKDHVEVYEYGGKGSLVRKNKLLNLDAKYCGEKPLLHTTLDILSPRELRW